MSERMDSKPVDQKAPADVRLSVRPATDNGGEIRAVIAAIRETLRMCDSEARILILAALLGGPRDVSTLAHLTGSSMSKASRHLTGLKSVGLLSCPSVANRRLYALSHALRIELREDCYELWAPVPPSGGAAVGVPRAIV